MYLQLSPYTPLIVPTSSRKCWSSCRVSKTLKSPTRSSNSRLASVGSPLHSCIPTCPHLSYPPVYKDLPHPPSSYLVVPTTTPYTASTPRGPIKYAFRPADGSNYNPLFPSLGKAGTPYARSVPSANFTPISTLPDPSLVFDTLLRREPGTFTPHPGGISSLFFAFADLVTHSIFNTNHSDWNINDASSYLDLSILYGSSDSAVDKVRRKDGTGRLWDDVFSDGRLLFMPPSSCALLVLMNRNHNVRSPLNPPQQQG